MVSSFQVKKNVAQRENQDTNGDGLPISMPASNPEDKTDGKATDPIKKNNTMIEEKKGDGKDNQGNKGNSASEPNVSMDQVRDKLQNLADKGEVEVIKDGKKLEDSKESDNNRGTGVTTSARTAAAISDQFDFDENGEKKVGDAGKNQQVNGTSDAEEKK